MQRLTAIVALLLVAGCGGTQFTAPPTALHSDFGSSSIVGGPAQPTPDDLTSVDCPGGGGPTGGALSGLGATLGAFTAAHGPQDPQYPAQFGPTISGGVNDLLPTFTARCSSGGTIVSVAQNLAVEAPAVAVKADLAGYGIMPPDATLVSDSTPTPCEILMYHSAAIAAVDDASDPAGTFLVELIPGSDAPGDLSRVGSLIYDLDTTGGC